MRCALSFSGEKEKEAISSLLICSESDLKPLESQHSTRGGKLRDCCEGFYGLLSLDEWL